MRLVAIGPRIAPSCPQKLTLSRLLRCTLHFLSTGAGEGNRTLVCSLGSSAFFLQISSLDTKLTLFALNTINRIPAICKTFLEWERLATAPIKCTYSIATLCLGALGLLGRRRKRKAAAICEDEVLLNQGRQTHLFASV